jgi:hypothetical protein
MGKSNPLKSPISIKNILRKKTLPLKNKTAILKSMNNDLLLCATWGCTQTVVLNSIIRKGDPANAGSPFNF